MKRFLANTVATAVALLVGATTLWVSLRFLKSPEAGLDWAVLILSGCTTGTIAWFVTWGHFQSDPTPNASDERH